ncbi:MAG TPA: hypothetical protein VFS71_09955 [Flavobacterium sp.]|uniref:hypothetical protein n=1 Tax=Flavobacterium sp. TaxID=239 RepID=UPI002DB93DE4|nr:hypothetical protein [Flavobacterium sp.]HEU4789998.1 hypothetical protein [Flavobacterium sp.]
MSYKYEERIVAFIDILGFANIIKASVNSQEQLDKIASALTYIHRYFNLVRVDYEDPSTLQLSQFSDSIVISVSMKDSSEMLAIFKHLKMIQINLLYQGILLRGGITKGKLIHTDNLLLGPGMINAYNLESKCAMHPRIVIDPKVLWQFARVNGQKQLERLKDFHYENSFATEEDGLAYIDYFNDVDEYLEYGGGVHAYFSGLCRIVAKYIDSEDISIKVKYLWMREKIKKSEYYTKYKTTYKGIISNRNKKPKV